MRLTRSEALGRGDLEQALREITETAAAVLGVQRCGIWRYNDDLSALICIELYTASDDVHEHGVELQTSEYPLYFAALREAQIVATHDARTDPRTAEFRDDYLAPLSVTSMLDAPLQLGGRMVGVICNEHVGPRACSRASPSRARSRSSSISPASRWSTP
jgi:GAF domain-containing protein